MISQRIVLVGKGENSWHRGRELKCEEVEGGGGRGEEGGGQVNLFILPGVRLAQLTELIQV